MGTRVSPPLAIRVYEWVESAQGDVDAAVFAHLQSVYMSGLK